MKKEHHENKNELLEIEKYRRNDKFKKTAKIFLNRK